MEEKEDNEARRIREEKFKKWLRASRRKQARKKNAKATAKEQLGKMSSKIVIARKSKLKKRRKKMTGERKTRWKYNGMRMRCWRRLWNEEGWKEALCSWKSCKKYQSSWYVNECPKRKSKVQRKEEVKAWSIK